MAVGIELPKSETLPLSYLQAQIKNIYSHSEKLDNYLFTQRKTRGLVPSFEKKN